MNFIIIQPEVEKPKEQGHEIDNGILVIKTIE